jgi:hypothetical protein
MKRLIDIKKFIQEYSIPFNDLKVSKEIKEELRKELFAQDIDIILEILKDLRERGFSTKEITEKISRIIQNCLPYENAGYNLFFSFDSPKYFLFKVYTPLLGHLAINKDEDDDDYQCMVWKIEEITNTHEIFLKEPYPKDITFFIAISKVKVRFFILKLNHIYYNLNILTKEMGEISLGFNTSLNRENRKTTLFHPKY